jgi:HlyD family secretion protein
VVSLLPPGNIFVRFFVPEPQFSTIHLGDRVALSCDGCTGNMPANVSFISPQAEYTPPLIYSESSKAKLVFLVEARTSREQAVKLNPGEPVEVRPIGSGAP